MANVLGVIAEYNPFHNGHFYHLEKSKKDTGSNYSIAVISGNFTQRRILFYNWYMVKNRNGFKFTV